MNTRELREQAARCRRLADLIGRNDVSRTLRDLAEEYEGRVKAMADDERTVQPAGEICRPEPAA
jgi:hypothetical protein